MRTIFLADREKHVRRAIRLVLEQQTDFEVIGEAEHTESLVAQVCQKPPDIILLDWDLAGTHHARLFSTLEKHCPNTTLIVMSIKPEHAQKAKSYGVENFLPKHLDPEKFIQKLTEFLSPPARSRY